MAEDCLGKIYFKVEFCTLSVQSLKRILKKILFSSGWFSGELQPGVRNIECKFAQVQVLSRSTYQEWGHCQVRYISWWICDVIVIMMMVILLMTMMVRLKLVPDDRRCLQSPTLTGEISNLFINCFSFLMTINISHFFILDFYFFITGENSNLFILPLRNGLISFFQALEPFWWITTFYSRWVNRLKNTFSLDSFYI